MKAMRGMPVSGTVPAVAGGQGPVSLVDAGGLSEGEIAEAERVLAAVLPPFDPAAMPAAHAVRLVLAAGLTAAAAGVVLSGPVWAAVCAAGIAGWMCLAGVRMRVLARKGRTAGLAEAAAVHAAVLPGRVPAGTLAAAGWHLPAVAAARRGRAWLYVAPCPGPDLPCTVYCATAATMPMGRQAMVILGEHLAVLPDVAGAALAHEAGHHANRWLWHVNCARSTLAWGWAAAGLAGALAGGWPAAAIAGGVFWLVSLLALWAGETACDLRSARTEGYPAAEAGFGYMAGVLAGRAAAVTVLDWAAGPAHPPLRLRRALVRALTRRDVPGHGRQGNR